MVVLLFAYGTLSPGCPDSARLGGWEPDEVRGRLFDLGPYPGLVDVDDPSAGWVSGYVREFELSELAGPIDAYEEAAGGLFERRLVSTKAGRSAWVYQYTREISRGDFKRIDRWEGRRIDINDPGQLRRFW